jgi:hypothetical protein
MKTLDFRMIFNPGNGKGNDGLERMSFEPDEAGINKGSYE